MIVLECSVSMVVIVVISLLTITATVLLDTQESDVMLVRISVL